MSHEQDKFNHSKRLHADETAIKKQTKIAKEHRVSEYNPSAVKQLCGNPRKTHKDKLTQQEKRLFQDLDKTTDRHSNGLKPNNGET